MKKIAITKSGKDLLRIIPFNGNEDTIDLKISLLKNEYSVYYWSLDDTTPIKKETSSEITYHSSEANGSKSSKVQIKENEDNYTFTFNKVIDAKLNSEFPIPIFKLGIKDNSGCRTVCVKMCKSL